jgi:hypothetical protein
MGATGATVDGDAAVTLCSKESVGCSKQRTEGIRAIPMKKINMMIAWIPIFFIIPFAP